MANLSIPPSHATFRGLAQASDWISAGVAFGCVVVAAMAAGLTMGTVSLEALDLHMKVRSGKRQGATLEELATAKSVP